MTPTEKGIELLDRIEKLEAERELMLAVIEAAKAMYNDYQNYRYSSITIKAFDAELAKLEGMG